MSVGNRCLAQVYRWRWQPYVSRRQFEPESVQGGETDKPWPCSFLLGNVSHEVFHVPSAIRKDRSPSSSSWWRRQSQLSDGLVDSQVFYLVVENAIRRSPENGPHDLPSKVRSTWRARKLASGSGVAGRASSCNLASSVLLYFLCSHTKQFGRWKFPTTALSLLLFLKLTQKASHNKQQISGNLLHDHSG